MSPSNREKKGARDDGGKDSHKPAGGVKVRKGSQEDPTHHPRKGQHGQHNWPQPDQGSNYDDAYAPQYPDSYQYGRNPAEYQQGSPLFQPYPLPPRDDSRYDPFYDLPEDQQVPKSDKPGTKRKTKDTRAGVFESQQDEYYPPPVNSGNPYGSVDVMPRHSHSHHPAMPGGDPYPDRTGGHAQAETHDGYDMGDLQEALAQSVQTRYGEQAQGGGEPSSQGKAGHGLGKHSTSRDITATPDGPSGTIQGGAGSAELSDPSMWDYPSGQDNPDLWNREEYQHESSQAAHQPKGKGKAPQKKHQSKASQASNTSQSDPRALAGSEVDWRSPEFEDDTLYFDGSGAMLPQAASHTSSHSAEKKRAAKGKDVMPSKGGDNTFHDYPAGDEAEGAMLDPLSEQDLEPPGTQGPQIPQGTDDNNEANPYPGMHFAYGGDPRIAPSYEEQQYYGQTWDTTGYPDMPEYQPGQYEGKKPIPNPKII
ncbi:hypothetical protein GQ53DRAFT_517732 [Thozetella sp. PMI_491]|nr:hypothetical protein GQ53DRAFT_517732 [Thozetella sp. PMI_491]